MAMDCKSKSVIDSAPESIRGEPGERGVLASLSDRPRRPYPRSS